MENEEQTCTISRDDLLRLDFLASMCMAMMFDGVSPTQALVLAELTGYSPESTLDALKHAHEILGMPDEPTEE